MVITKSTPEGYSALLLWNWDFWLGLHGKSIKCLRSSERHPGLLPKCMLSTGLETSPLEASLFARSERNQCSVLYSALVMFCDYGWRGPGR